MMMNPENDHLRILLFGATGRTGGQVLKMALKAGHELTAVVRNPEKVALTHPRLTIVHGDATARSTFDAYAHQKDAIISCIGVSSTKPTILYSEATATMLSVMADEGIRRIICISAAGIETSPKLPLVFRLLSKYVVQWLFRYPYSDTRLMEKMLRESSADWTSVRPPLLKDKPFTGKYRYVANGWLEKCIRINRADLAGFIVENITNIKTYKAIVEVAN